MEKSAVVIFRDGKQMTATYVRGEEEVAMATAKCNPSDKFDYAFGANLAVTRLMKKVQKVASSRKRRK